MIFPFRCAKCKKVFEVEGPIGRSPSPPMNGGLCVCGGYIMRQYQSLPDHWRTSGVYKTDKALYPTGNPDIDNYDAP